MPSVLPSSDPTSDSGSNDSSSDDNQALNDNKNSPKTGDTGAPTFSPTLSMAPSMAPSFGRATMNQKMACVSVIDEAVGTPFVVSKDLIDSNWTRFRDLYPDRPFCLLRPNAVVPGTGFKLVALHIPRDFLEDDKAVVRKVTRDYGNRQNASNWFDVCGMADLRASGVTGVSLFVDDSGSLTADMVAASRAQFSKALCDHGMTMMEVVNGNENWVLPHIANYTGYLA